MADDSPLREARGLNCPSYDVFEVDVIGGELCDTDPLVLLLFLRLRLFGASGNLRMSCSNKGICGVLVAVVVIHG